MKEVIKTVKATDFVLNPKGLTKTFQLVEVTEAKEYIDGNATDKVLGYNYSVVLENLRFEKMSVLIPSNVPAFNSEDLDNGTIKIEFQNLETRASVYNGRISVKATADSVARIKDKTKMPTSNI